MSIPTQATHLLLSAIRADAQVRTRNGFDKESLEGLAAAIKAHGMIAPIVVRPDPEREGCFVVVAGERRLIAASMAGLTAVPVSIQRDLSETTLAVQIVENIQRVDLSLLDRADGVSQLVRDVGAARASQWLGKSRPWVSKMVTVSKMHETLRLAAQEGDCQDVEVLQSVHQLSKKKGAQLQYGKALRLMAQGDLTRADARRMLDAASEAPVETEQATPDDAGEADVEETGDDTAPDDAAQQSLLNHAHNFHKLCYELMNAAQDGDLDKIRDAYKLMHKAGPGLAAAIVPFLREPS